MDIDNMKFYKCSKCQQIYINLFNNESNLSCCENQTEVLEPNSFETDENIHIPIVRRIGNFVTVSIGEEPHPMVDIHYISFVLLKTNHGVQYKHLKPNDKPVINFFISDDEKVEAVYAHCTIHFLWEYNN